MAGKVESIGGFPCRVTWSQRDLPQRPIPSANVFIRNLPYNVDYKRLQEVFSQFGVISFAKVPKSAQTRFPDHSQVVLDDFGNSKGYGYLKFDSEEAATQVIAMGRSYQIDGANVDIVRFVSRSQREAMPQDNMTNLFVKNIPETFDQVRLLTVWIDRLTNLPSG